MRRADIFEGSRWKIVWQNIYVKTYILDEYGRTYVENGVAAGKHKVYGNGGFI